MADQYLTKDYLNYLFEYKNGELFWKNKTSPFSNMLPGQKAGNFGKENYQYVSFNKIRKPLHSVIYCMFYGKLPKLIDHIDGNVLNNKIENLREASFNQNSWNRKLNSNSKSGCKNVFWNKRLKKWQVRLQIYKKKKEFGFYEDLELADLVAQEVRDKYHREFARN